MDGLDDQALLEDILDETKPPVPEQCQGLHWLYMTPFRYGRYPKGSRFRRAGRTPGVCYVSEHQDTAVIEMAFHLLLFYADSPRTPFPKLPTEHTCFDVPIKAAKAIRLTRTPFSKAANIWMHPSNYSDTQSLEELARAAEIDVISYASVRDPENKGNAAVLNCMAFANRGPTIQQTWRLWFSKTGVHAICEFSRERFSLAPAAFENDERMRGFIWGR